MSPATSRNRILTASDVQRHNTTSSFWVSRNGIVYDLTPFLSDHPGGDDILHPYAGLDLGASMSDASEHIHSQSAYDMMDAYRVGVLGGNEKTISEDWVATEDFHPDETDTISDFTKTKFLDLSRPLLYQVWTGNFSKEYYLEQVHQPRHLAESARLFQWDALEILTRTKWWVVPMVWGPITMFLGFLGLMQTNDPSITATSLLRSLSSPSTLSLPSPSAYSLFLALSLFLVGNLIWTILEYTLHRFLFHIDFYLPDTNVSMMLHFLLHGIHHYLPMDKLRLVMPPTLFAGLSYPFTRLAHALFPKNVANGIIAGAYTFYIVYDCAHYALHHTRLPAYLTEMKKYHLAHHYKNFELGFGVTSKLWDWVFGTVLGLDEGKK